MNIYYSVTNNCNLKCSHCFQDSGPNKKDTTISVENFRKSIDNLTKDNHSLDLTITGGEPLTIKENLYNYLDVLKQKENVAYGIQTNGFWGQNVQTAKNIISKLKELGVSEIDITSDDKYHFNEGIKIFYLTNIRDIAKEYGIACEIRGSKIDSKIFPKGRARNLVDSSKIKYNYNDCENFLEEKSFSIKPDGSVYACAFSLFKLPGNIIEEPIGEIIKRASEDNILLNLNNRGISGVAKIFGMKNKEINKEISRHGNCGLCAKLNGFID